MKNGLTIIAEVKTHSPYGFVSGKGWDELFQVADSIGDIISIHTDSRWHGSNDLISKAKSLTSKPILAKGIHESDEDVKQAINSGADFVLVVGRMPEVYIDKCFIEPLTLDELKHLPSHVKVVWNSRDLKTGALKKETFEEARTIFPAWLCQASNIQTKEDIKAGANGVLVGTNLLKFSESLLYR